MNGITLDELTQEKRNLLLNAKGIMETAYNPYSNFYVGTALLAQDGHVITGSNVENAAYGSTICAERSALVRANAMGYRIFSTVAIIARGMDFDTAKVTAPCGSCRQMLYEASQVSGTDLEIIMSTTKMDRIVISSISELLPMGFGPSDMGVDIKRYQRIHNPEPLHL